MNLQRVRADIQAAKEHFPNIESYTAADGTPYIKVMLMTSIGKMYVANVTFDSFPSLMPKVTVTAPAIKHGMHMYTAGHICYMHPSHWNPARHDLLYALMQAAVWLNKNDVYMATGRWPGPSLKHTA